MRQRHGSADACNVTISTSVVVGRRANHDWPVVQGNVIKRSHVDPLDIKSDGRVVDTFSQTKCLALNHATEAVTRRIWNRRRRREEAPVVAVFESFDLKTSCIADASGSKGPQHAAPSFTRIASLIACESVAIGLCTATRGRSRGSIDGPPRGVAQAPTEGLNDARDGISVRASRARSRIARHCCFEQDRTARTLGLVEAGYLASSSQRPAAAHCVRAGAVLPRAHLAVALDTQRRR